MGVGSDIGLIGLGVMGKPIAENLLKSGISLWVNDVSEAACAALCEKGARVASKRELAERCEIVFTILPHADAVRVVLFGEDGLESGLYMG